MEIETHWVVRYLDEVIGYYSKDFTTSKGKPPLSVEHFCDSAQGKVVFKITSEKEM